MKKLLTGLFLLALSFSTARAQKFASDAQPYGKIDKADLELKICEFEKDANAMVLFQKGDLYYDDNLNIIIDHHKRIKIFNDNGKKAADIRIEYYGGNRYEYVTGLQAQVYNLVDGKVEITKIDKKQIFTENIDKNRMALVFSFPNIKPGSVIEYKYTQTINVSDDIPNWYFQDDIPVKYSELQTTIPEWFYFTVQQRAFRPFTKRAKLTKSRSYGSGTSALLFTENMDQYAMSNVESIAREPYMTSRVDNLQSLFFHLTHFNPPAGFSKSYSDSWAKVGGGLAEHEDFGAQLKRKLTGEAAIIDKAKTFKTNEQKIAYVFNEVKNTMKWNNSDDWYTNEGTVKAWEKKIGNSTEVNLILYRLLKQSGVDAYPMVVSTRSHGRVNPMYSFLYQFNRGVVYVPVDSAKSYVLDATNKYNTYFDIPAELVGSYGLYIDKENKRFDLITLQRKTPVRKVVMLNAQILPDGKMDGTAMINSFSYHRTSSIENYKTNGEKKYIEYLRDNDNTLSITSLKMDNIDVDSLPLLHNIAFKQELTGSDKDYIYFSSNIFTSMYSNPFLSENRITDIDFGHLNSYNLTGMFKLPAGYKLEALPKSISLQMPDQSISCRRVVAEENGTLMIRYLINYNKSLFNKDDYPPVHDFYKKMYELLNEKVVLKKS
ncbi:DUF3857 domain-containing protein [Mucilaginibacter terrae]|uniref:DUF3857 domain-containing protein n=1 Tax=Mucilaginibacter terrae TaxID=1955052 RepID=A0ABU3GT26_9SPHI|nr:DUF3857 domain-containing protein [Mucilaginibacter terrae]MDT3402932.1 hypothetical protein [Mucilaginibacter terrae]